LRAGSTEQRQLLRIRIVLEAADGHATREIARELETTPTTVSLWRIRYAREGLDGLEDRLRSGTPPIYDEATDQRIRKVLDQPPPKGFARWNGPLIARSLGDVDVQYVWRSLRKQKIDLAGRNVLEAVQMSVIPKVIETPKIAAVDLIAALEPVGRGASMGALGRVYGNGDFELTLTIRTFAVTGGRIHLWVGGGIVWDSDPEDEVEESWTKARPLLAAIGAPLVEDAPAQAR